MLLYLHVGNVRFRKSIPERAIRRADVDVEVKFLKNVT